MTGLPAALIARATTSHDDARIVAGAVWWIEGRADGRDVLVRWTPEHGSQDATPDGSSVASYVHEYGGGAWVLAGDEIWFCNADDQRLYRSNGSTTTAVDPVPAQPGAIRYGDLRLDPGGHFLWGVRERHSPERVSNELVVIPVEAPTVPRVAASGWDFYASPRPSPDGHWLAWTCWNAPLMPWDGTYLYVAAVSPDGGLGEPVLVAGGPEESVFQPAWSPDGVLHFISDRTGWWGLYAWRDGTVVPVLVSEAERGVAQWEFGYATYAFLDGDRIAVITQHGSRQSLEILEHGRLRQLDLPYTSVKPYLSGGEDQVALIASTPAQLPAVIVVDVRDGSTRTIAAVEPVGDPPSLAKPEPFVFTAQDGIEIHGLFYAPWDSSPVLPPLVVKAHPGPTANVPMRLDWHTQFLASHGFAVAEIDYRGSTGYGRAFRNALRGTWGEHDARDCAESAARLAAMGKADLKRTAIWGASAGGYTTLSALIRTNTFAAGIARSPVIDPRTWRDTAPKFQAHYCDSLVGPWPEASETYRARSVMENAAAIDRPVLLIHGDQDRVTPAAESRALATALGDRAQLIIFPEEGHGLRSPDTQRRVLEIELRFLSRVLKEGRDGPDGKHR